MGIFDDLKQQAEDLLGNVGGGVQDATENLGDIGGQIQDALPGQDNEENK